MSRLEPPPPPVEREDRVSVCPSAQKYFAKANNMSMKYVQRRSSTITIVYSPDESYVLRGVDYYNITIQ